MEKNEIAKIFEEIAYFLELKGENPFRARAYRNAARTLLHLDKDLMRLIKEERLTELEGVGEDLAEKITTLATKNRLPFYEKLKRSIPSGMLAMSDVQGLGPKKIKRIYEKLKIRTLEELKEACEKGKLSKMKGFGAKTEKNILEALAHKQKYSQRFLWWDAMQLATPLLEELKTLKGVKKVAIAGSLRRKLETVGDLDFLVAAAQPAPIMDKFTQGPSIERILAKGPTKSSVRLTSGIQADLRIVPEEQFAFALCYFTGSKEHNIKLREAARKKGWTLSEWGLISQKTKKPVLRARTESDIYEALGFPYIPPELREDKGEFKGKLPQLVEEKDIRGTFHNHTTASDGRSTLKEMALAADKMGWEYIGIADHSQSSVQARGLSESALYAQIEQIAKMNASKKFRAHIFAGTECDILPDGSLDYPDALLKELDYVVISIHSAFQQDEKTLTRRLIKAIEHPYSTMVGHLTGRLLLRREPYRIHCAKVIDACIANKKIIEINAHPQRLDMDWRLWHAASDKGLLCCINTDAHSADQLDYFRAGVHIARKGWLQKKHIINTLPLKSILHFLHNISEKYK